MKIKAFLLTTIFFFSLFSYGQNILKVEDVSLPNDVYSGEKDDACVVIRCHESIPLEFSSTMDKKVEIFNKDTEGSDILYYLSFPTGKRYRGRKLSIASPGYYTVVYDLELEPKQMMTLRASDPNSLVDAGCYREHRNQGLEEFKKMNYEAARTLFVSASTCSDVVKKENDKHLAMVDSLLHYRDLGDKYYYALDYDNALTCYSKAKLLNTADTYLLSRMEEITQVINTNCQVNFQLAEAYYQNKEYNKALALFNEIVNNNCPKAVLASAYIININSYVNRRKEHTNVFTYEWSKNMPIGFHFGNYYKNKVGGFLSLSTNALVLNAAQSDLEIDDYPEVSLNFGWTFKIVNPVWMFIGPGVTTKMYVGKWVSIDENGNVVIDKNKEKKGYPMDESSRLREGEESLSKEDLNRHFNAAVAIPITAGFVIKYSYFSIRAGYEYRFSPEKRLENFLGKSRFSIGIGLAF